MRGMARLVAGPHPHGLSRFAQPGMRILALLAAVSGCDRAAHTGPPSPPLLRLAQAWARDPELMAANSHPMDDLSRCPQAQREMRASNAAVVPPTFVRFEAIATHACDAVLRVFLGCTEATGDGTSCLSWRQRLVVEPVGTGAAEIVGDLDPVRGGNSSGLFVPLAFTRGDRWILLRAWMFSPGAGGGAVDYGVGVIARSTRRGDAPIEVQPLPARDPSFYADFGCAIRARRLRPDALVLAARLPQQQRRRARRRRPGDAPAAHAPR